MNQEVALKKHMCIPFLDTNRGSGTEEWARIDKSTIFSLNPNPQTETRDYICYETPETEITHYEPELPQEIVMNAGNPMYDFVFGIFYDLPTGEDAKVPALICFPPDSEGAMKAWKVPGCVLQLGEMNTVDRKISFTLKLGGDIERGTYTVEAGKPTFKAGAAAAALRAPGDTVVTTTKAAKANA